MSGQLRLEWPPGEDYGADSFVSGPATADAERMLWAWRDWPGAALALIGPEGAGKTHLARLWASEAGARLIGPGDTPPDGAALVYEDIDRGLDEALSFRIINEALAGERPAVLFTAQRPPAAWPAGLADLQSRFRALATVSIAPPGDAELAQILGKLLRDRQVRPGQRLIEFLLRRIERSAGGARAAIEALDQAAALRGERINLKLAQDYYAESTQDTRS